jgi:hypothetical protein
MPAQLSSDNIGFAPFELRPGFWCQMYVSQKLKLASSRECIVQQFMVLLSISILYHILLWQVLQKAVSQMHKSTSLLGTVVPYRCSFSPPPIRKSTRLTGSGVVNSLQLVTWQRLSRLFF